MSYVDEVYELVVSKNPAQPEFHQAVKEVLNSLRPVVEANEEAYRLWLILAKKWTLKSRFCELKILTTPFLLKE